jgi:hypothetical protein
MIKQNILIVGVAVVIAVSISGMPHALAQTNMTSQQKIIAVLKILKSGTPHQKIIVCHGITRVLQNYTTSPIHQNLVDHIAAFIWLKVYDKSCLNVTGAIKLNG